MFLSNLKFSTRFLFGFMVIILVSIMSAVWIGWRSYSILYENSINRLKDLVDMTHTLLSEYDQRVKKGEFSLEEGQKRAAQRIRHLRYSGKEYFTITDFQPKTIMHPYKPELEGKDASELKDPTGKRFVTEFVKVCKEKGEGYVDYMWPKHEGSKPVPKIAYVKAFEPWKWIVSTGVYIDDLEAFKRRIYFMIAFPLLILVGIGVLFYVFVLRALTKPMEATAHGLSEAAEQVSSAATEVSSASQTLAEGASEQAASIEETSSSLEEISSMTQQNAAHARECDRIMKEEVSNNYRLIDERLKQMQDAITKTVKAGEETGRIIKTIDEIAFQTNLLALNAAVEAARAGEAGAGFAVVADEVRSLAMRAAEAAKTTANLIEESNKRIKEASQLTSQVVEAMQVNASYGQKVTELVSEVAAASNEQAQGIEQVNKAVSEMEKTVQQVAATAQQAASAAEELNSQAEEMKGFVRELMSLIQGSKAKVVGAGFKAPKMVTIKPQTEKAPIPAAKKAEKPKVQIRQAPKKMAAEAKKEVRPEDIIPLDDEDLKKF